MAKGRCDFFNKILLPTDGSNHSFKAAKYVAELAKICSSEVTLLHVLKTSVADDPIEVEADTWISPIEDEKKIKERGKKVVEKTKEIFTESKIPVETKYFIYGHPSKAILETAEKENFDLIVMGSHGLEGIKRFALGSVADRVARYSSCPVFIVR
jgi:nucleotide-binding universal stress UspA family protein